MEDVVLDQSDLVSLVETDTHSILRAKTKLKHKIPPEIDFDLRDSDELFVSLNREGRIEDIRGSYKDALRFLSNINGNEFWKSKPSIKKLLMNEAPIIGEGQSRLELGKFDVHYKNGAILEILVSFDGEYQFEFSLFIDNIEADYLVTTGQINQSYTFRYKSLKYILSI